MTSTASLRANCVLEDYVAVRALKDSTILLAGVFDGHSGIETALVASHVLPNYIERNLPSSDLGADGIDAYVQQAFMQLDQNMSDSRYRIISESPGLKPTEEEEDREKNRVLRHLGLKGPQVGSTVLPPEPLRLLAEAALSGSCGCVRLVSAAFIFVANTGDSGAVLGVKEVGPGAWSERAMSEPHNGTNPDEVLRIEDIHAEEGPLFKRQRLHLPNTNLWKLLVEVEKGGVLPSVRRVLPRRGFLSHAPLLDGPP